MLITDRLNRPCTITRRQDSATEDDDYGNPVTDETTVETVCELQQRQRAEPTGQGELSDTSWLLILPAGTLIDTSDIVTVDGRDFEMVGDPWHARNPRTQQEEHVEATLRRTVGADDEVGS